MILETAVRDAKLAQDLELESLCNGVGHSQMVKDHPIANDSGSRDCVKLASPTAVSRMILRLKACIALLLLSSCCDSLLFVHTDYVNEESLASFVIKTPDPLLDNPPIGQRVIIGWSLPHHFMQIQDLHLKITVHHRNREEIYLEYPVKQRKDYYIYSLLNEEYVAAKGILTYKVDLYGDGIALEEWRHQMWSELIHIQNDCPIEEQIH